MSTSNEGKARYLRLSSIGKRVILYHPVPEDTDVQVKALYESESTRKYIRALPAVWPLETVRANREKRTANPLNIDFAIYYNKSQDAGDGEEHPSNSQFAGLCNLTVNPLNSSAQAGIYIAGEYQSLHLASEALHALISHGFTKESDGGPGLHRIAFETAVDNVQMRGWLERTLEIEKEYVHREAWRDPKGWLDLVGYAILDHEWTGERDGSKGLETRLREKIQSKIKKAEQDGRN
ncbi:hypothetical protein FRC02_009712 [Tulasnella sp. 418]|nr:hypothetical protein FRC02_009712 [Tulasnella sp. 418]